MKKESLQYLEYLKDYIDPLILEKCSLDGDLILVPVEVLMDAFLLANAEKTICSRLNYICGHICADANVGIINDDIVIKYAIAPTLASVSFKISVKGATDFWVAFAADDTLDNGRNVSNILNDIIMTRVVRGDI